jgi:hypothetical protein
VKIKNTPTTLKKLEGLFDEAGYTVRYERGHFQSGYCLLEARRVVVINRFLDLEGRINALIEILPAVNVSAADLSSEMQVWYKGLMQDLPASDGVQTNLPLE